MLPASAEPSFEAVYSGQFEFVWRTLRAMGVSESSLDDAVQDVFIVIHRRLPEFEGRASVRTWAYEIARRVASRYRTRAAKHASRHSEMPELRAREDLDSALDHAKAVDVMREFLGSLDEDRRRAFVLAEFGEMPGREIAETLEVNMNTIYARIRSARTELDRVAKRLHAHDSGAVTRALRSRRPSEGAQRRAWAGIVAVVGSPSAVAATAGISSAAIAWMLGTIAAGGMATAVILGRPPAEGAQSPPAVTQPAAVVPPERPSSPPAVVELAAAPEPAPVTAPARPHRLRPTKRSAPPPSLTDEVEQVRAIRRAIRQTRPQKAQAAIDAYRENFARGSLRTEVDALEVELACRSRSRGAQTRLETFRRSRPDAALLTRLESVCSEKIGPQNPQGDETHP